MHLLPHEAEVRRWVGGRRRRFGGGYDADDIVQEAYARIGNMDFAAIRNPRAYFFETARNLIFEHVKRERVVMIDGLTDGDLRNVMDSGPDPETVLSARQDLRRFQDVVDSLPPQCREAFVLRKLNGLSQRQIAAHMGLSESTVEKHLARALKLVLERYETADGRAASPDAAAKLRAAGR